MILKPIDTNDVNSFDETEYNNMSAEERLQMISESKQKIHNGKYFEIFKVLVDDVIVGFMNLYAHSEHIISCGPEIKKQYRRSGYAYEAEKEILSSVKSKGYTIAVGEVMEENSASRALHEKLGFEIYKIYTKNNGKCSYLYIKAL